LRDCLAAITRGFQAAGHVMEIVLLVAVVAYIVYRISIYRKNAVFRAVPRIQVQELARRLASGDKDKLLIADVRSHGYYDSYAARIEGSIRIEPNNLTEEIQRLADQKDKDIYLYCT
jgi:hypothetical protein